MKFRDLKIGTKQLIGFGLMLLIMAGSNFYSVNKMELLKSEIEEVSNNWLPRAIAISDINLNTHCISATLHGLPSAVRTGFVSMG